ncbi:MULTISPECIES: hypothetical protein [Rhodomicrobium]|uniref:hypothetical protein n=1 Tax=Rhodomicrobium TaxID=1068 RepID=UPI000B4B507E|nr:MULTISPECIES: hypothetical protein [Rhodomicrobium]
MLDLLKRTARLLEEKAAGLPVDNQRRAHLIALAGATRQVALERAAAHRKHRIVTRLTRQGVPREEAEFASRLALKAGDRPFRLHNIVDLPGIAGADVKEAVVRLQALGVVEAADGEDLAFRFAHRFRWVAGTAGPDIAE